MRRVARLVAFLLILVFSFSPAVPTTSQGEPDVVLAGYKDPAVEFQEITGTRPGFNNNRRVAPTKMEADRVAPVVRETGIGFLYHIQGFGSYSWAMLMEYASDERYLVIVNIDPGTYPDRKFAQENLIPMTNPRETECIARQCLFVYFSGKNLDRWQLRKRYDFVAESKSVSYLFEYEKPSTNPTLADVHAGE